MRYTRNTESSERYVCKQRSFDGIPGPLDPVWNGLPLMQFVRVEHGDDPVLPTEAKAFYDINGRALFVGFWGRDDDVLSDYIERDEPIFHQDVFELFIGDSGELYRYKELQISPFNVQYDADITYRSSEQIDIRVEWDFDGWESMTSFDETQRLLYSAWRLSFSGFAAIPTPGDVWRANLYRCDHGAEGVELSAWQPTGISEFHVPECFGYFEFACEN